MTPDTHQVLNKSDGTQGRIVSFSNFSFLPGYFIYISFEEKSMFVDRVTVLQENDEEDQGPLHCLWKRTL